MAHFAQIDENGTVLQVIVVPNHKCLNDQGQEDEAVGVAFCQSLIPYTNWVQTSYNGNIRRRYAGIGFTYDVTRDAFLPPQPYPSWLLNEETLDWYPPVPRPETVTEGFYLEWNEESQTWQEIAIPEPVVTDVIFTEVIPEEVTPVEINLTTAVIEALSTATIEALSTSQVQNLTTSSL
jgi:hypothetical protein